jgi:hypothetical protein
MHGGGTFKRKHKGKAKCHFPITKNGKLSCSRVRNAGARGSQQGVIETLKNNGLCTYERKCKIESEFCG